MLTGIMIKMGIEWLAKNWLPVVIGLAIIGIGVYIMTLQHEVEILERDKTELQLKFDRNELKIEEQNLAIEELSAIANNNQSEMDILHSQMNKLGKMNKKYVSQIIKSKKPKDCESAILFLINAVEDYKWEK